jgi:hypothetical protein
MMRATWRRVAAVVLVAVGCAGALVACRKPSPSGSKVGVGVLPNNLALVTTTQINTQLLAMPAATAAGKPPFTHLRSQAAQPGSNSPGAELGFVVGASDGTAAGVNPSQPFFWFGQENTPGSCTNEIGGSGCLNYMILKWLGSGVMNMLLGGGTDNIGGGVNAVEVSSAVPMNIATEGKSPISFNPNNGVAGQQQSGFIMVDQPGDTEPSLQLQTFSQPNPGAGFLRLPYGDSGNSQMAVIQRNAANNDDLPLVSRQYGVATYGSLLENANYCSATTANVQLLNATGHGLTVSSVHGTTGAGFGVDTQSTWLEGENQYPCTHDCWVTQLYPSDTSANSQQTIATIPITSGTHAITQLKINVEGREVSTGDFATFTEAWTYDNNGGSIVAPSGSQPAATDTGHSTAATGIAPQFAVSGSNVLVKATPWTTSAVHWLTKVEMSTDMGAATAPTRPSGAALVVTSSSIGLGAVTTWTDQSGNGNNLVNASGASKPVNTANAGPGGNTNAVVFTSGTWMALKTANNALVGTKNFTIAIVAQVASTSGQQVFTSIGDTVTGTTLGTGIAGTSLRDIYLMGTPTPPGPELSAGPATTNWEAWVYTSDSNGNASLLVNGVNRPLSQQNAAPLSPSANFYVGSWNTSNGQLGGGIAEIDVWATAQNPAAVYAYEYGVWGL